MGLIIAIGRPNSAYVAAMESTPVCGVAIRNAVVAPRDAPRLLSEMAVGSTPHEQSGSGIPSSAAFTTGRHPRPARWWLMVSGHTNTWSTPASRNPSSI